MSIFVQVQHVIHQQRWDFTYDNRHDLFYAMRHKTVPLHTSLQGSYDLIIDVDQNREIVSFTATLSAESSQWQQDPKLEIPVAQPGEVHVIEDVDDGQTQIYFTDPNYSIFYARLGEPIGSQVLNHIAIADQIILDISTSGLLAGIWIYGLPAEICETHRMK